MAKMTQKQKAALKELRRLCNNQIKPGYGMFSLVHADSERLYRPTVVKLQKKFEGWLNSWVIPQLDILEKLDK